LNVSVNGVIVDREVLDIVRRLINLLIMTPRREALRKLKA
jgi:hypothetical protein